MSNDIICKYYIRGVCRFGDLCRFAHNIPVDSENENEDEQNQDLCIGLNLMPNQSSITSILNVKAKPFVPKSQRNTEDYNLNDNNEQKDVTTPLISSSAASASSSATSLLSASSYIDPTKTFAEVLGGGNNENNAGTCTNLIVDENGVLKCAGGNDCIHGASCYYIEFEHCDMCGLYRLHPTDQNERKRHIKECIQQHEKAMELSFAIARSQDKICGICFDTIMEKPGREQRFGILPNCNHIFCLECIRKWRQAKQFENKITRACPECRVSSDYVCPSAFWVETKEEKDKLLNDYKVALGEKDCKYFKKGKGKCPFGNKCFYKHALPNGLRIDVGVPQRNVRKLHRSDDEMSELFDIFLWDFVDRRNWIEEMGYFTDSDDSDWIDELL